jgi:tetratricopeptide (TPR) repeat protein
MSTLFLNMIVKNESQNIVRLFQSVLPIIDGVCVCDTGSTDNTIELIETFCKDNSIICKIVKEEFKNFEYSRNVALNACKGLSDYILLMDADMVLEVKNFDKSKLNEYDDYMLLQGNPSFYYFNKRIIKNNDNYNYIGVTHEYINNKSGVNTKKLTIDELFILDIGDGGCKSNKFERDASLLEEGIKEDPTNDRYHFYLANTYRDLGKNELSIEYYKKRIKLKGWEQEIWQCYYNIGLINLKLGKNDKAINSFIDCIKIVPYRLENIYELIKHYRLTSNHSMCDYYYNIFKFVKSQNKYIDDYLFLNKDVYTYLCDYEYTIFSYYLKNKNIQKELINVFNYSKKYDEIQNVLRNLKFYPLVLKQKDKICLTNEIIIDNIEYRSSSSSIIKDPASDGYVMNMRYVNYYIEDSQRYRVNNGIRTLNKYLKLNKNLEIETENILNYYNKDETISPIEGQYFYKGMEDLKLFSYNNEIYFIGTSITKENKIMMGTGKYNDTLIESKNLSCSFNYQQCEKNWIYTNYKNSLGIIYKWSPLTITKEKDDHIELIIEKQTPNIFHYARGSTCEYTFQNEKWFVLHYVSHEDKRCYYHMIAVLDNDYNILRHTSLFTFEQKEIEYCLGLVVEEDRVLITNSNWDRTTTINVYDKNYIDELMFSV